MKIEVDDDCIESLVKGWLYECIDLSRTDETDHPDDIEFWNNMREHCKWILKHNYHEPV